MTEQIPIFLALGSNQGDRWANLREAVDELATFMVVDRLSRVYETAPAYVTDQPPFLNMVLSGSTSLDPFALLRRLKEIEQRIGRTAGRRYGPRPIDVDILLYGTIKVDEPDLQIPHARMTERPFVLQPLSELAPDLLLPGAQATIQEFAQNAPPNGEIIACLGRLET